MPKVLVISPDAISDQCSSELAAAGYEVFHATGSSDSLELVESHGDIKFAVIDYRLTCSVIARVMKQMQDIAPNLVVIGQSDTNRRLDFTAVGIWQSLQDPWTSDEFIAIAQNQPQGVVRSRVVMTADAKQKWMSSLESRLQDMASGNSILQERITDALDGQRSLQDVHAALHRDAKDLADSVDARLSSLDAKLDSVVEAVSGLVKADHAASESPSLASRLDLIIHNQDEVTDSSVRDSVAYLRDNRVFDSLSVESLSMICKMGEQRTLEPGAELFESGAACESLYIVSSGVIEIRRAKAVGEPSEIAAYCGVGDILCGMGVLTFSNHTSTGIAPDGAEVLAIGRDLLVDIMFLFPHLAIGMYSTLAERIATAVDVQAFRSNNGDLQGCLGHFDLATILQGVILGQGRNGQFHVFDVNGGLSGRIQFGEGKISAAEVGDLKGRDAINKLFQLDLSDCSFRYSGDGSGVRLMDIDRELMSVSGERILLDAAVHADHHNRDSSSGACDSPAMALRRVAVELEWDDEETRELAQLVWGLLQDCTSMDDLLSMVSVDAGALVEVLTAMLKRGLITDEEGYLDADQHSSEAWVSGWGGKSEEA